MIDKTRKLLEYIRDYGTPITIGERAIRSCTVDEDALHAALREIAIVEGAIAGQGSVYTHDMMDNNLRVSGD